jgi:hypothetical protein
VSKGLYVFLMCLGVVSCGDGTGIEEKIRKNLNDPDSAKFRDVVVSESGRRACVGWNAKNMMGGYGEWKFARLEKKDSDWFVENMDIPESECSKLSLKAIDVQGSAWIEASQRAIDMLQKARSITRAEAIELAKESGGECGALSFQYSFDFSMLESNKILGDFSKVEGFSKNIKPLEDMLIAGDCSKDDSSLRYSLWPFTGYD